MKFIFTSEFFWGAFLILLGVSIIIKTIFGIDIPIIRTIIAIFLMYLGFTMITGKRKFFCNDKKTIAFDERTIKPGKVENFYSVMFGKGFIDLTDIEEPNKFKKVGIKTQFGETILKISKDIPTVVHAKVSFGSASFPNDEHISSGHFTYKNYADNVEPILEVDTYTTFGSLRVHLK